MTDQSTEQQPVKRPIIKYLNGRNGTYEYATVIDIGDLNNLKTSSKEDVVKAINSLIDGNFSLSGRALGQIQDMQNKLQQAGMGGQNHFSMSLVNNLGWTAANILREAESHKGYSLKVEPGEKWTIYRLGNTNNRWRFYWLNQKPADGSPVLDVAFSEDSQKPNTPNVVEVPDGVSWGFLYLSNRKTDKIPPIMINKGDEPHGWTPSSEDHNDGLGLTTEIEMVIDENKKRIEELRSKLDERTLNLEKEYQEKLKELSDKYTREMADLETSVDNAKATIEDTKANLARVKQELGEADTLNYKKLEQKVDEVNNAITQKIEERDFDNLEATVRDHTTKISQNAKDIELRATKQSLDHTTGRVLAVENKVNVNAEGIAASLRKDELRENLQPLGVYPENLLRNTRHWDNWEQGTPTKVTVENDTYQHTSILRFDDNEGSVTGRVDGLEVGETYNLSVWAKSTNRDTKLIARIGNTEHTLTHVESNNDRLSDSWGRYQFNFTAVDESTDIRFRPDRQRRGAQTRLAGAKVEWGTKFSGWREHLEDITDRVSNLETTIKVETGKIATRVSEVTETTGESISSLRQENTRQQNEIDANKQGVTEAKNLVGTEIEKVTKVVTRNSTELTQLSDSIQASAQRMTEITKQVGDTAENIKTELRQEFAQLTIKPDQITSIVKEAISNNQINLNFDLDGRNYVRNSDFFLTTGSNNTLMHWTGVNRLWEVVDVAEKKKGIKATRRGLSSNQEAAMYSNYFPIATGDKVTIGFDVITENTDSEILARLELYNDNNIRQHFENLTIESMSGKYRAGQRSRLHRQIKIERRDATKARLVLLLTRNGTITFTDVSVQKGDITSYGWQNAPEDSRDIQAIMETVIDQNKREIALKANSTTVDTLTSSLEESKGQIRVNSDNITSAVTRISNTEKKLQEKAAEITVNANAITQKVWQTDIDKTVRDKINELDIDDRNLLEGTSDEWGERLSQTGSNNLNIKEVSFSDLGLKNGDKFTVSMKWKNLSRIPLTVKVEQFRGRAVSSTDSVARSQYDTEFSEVLTSTVDTNKYDKVRIMIVGGNGAKAVQVKELKLQRGDKATGWFPNAKDIQSKIDQVSSEWKIEAGKITGTVQELSGDVSEYRQEAGRVTQTLTNLQGDINTTQNTVNRMSQTLYNEQTGLITKVEAMPGRWEVAVNNLDSRLGGNEIVSRINVEENTAKIQAKNIEFTGAVSISHLDSNARDIINRKADSSDVTSRIENVTSKIDNMTIGERNLWINSKGTLDGGTDINSSDYSEYKYFDRTHSHEYSMPVKAGETYTLRYSVYNRNSSRNVSTEMLLDGRRQYREEYTIPQNEAKTITDTYKFTSDGRATFKINSDWAIAFAPPMLVKGDKIVSEYKEAPEDLERLINQKISTSDAESKISSAVRDAKTEINNGVDGKITQAKQDIGSDVDSKITQATDPISNKVETINNTITGLNTSVGTINNSITNIDNKFNNLAIGERNLWRRSKKILESGQDLQGNNLSDFKYFDIGKTFSYEYPVQAGETYTLRFSVHNKNSPRWVTVNFRIGRNSEHSERYQISTGETRTFVETREFSRSGTATFEIASEYAMAFSPPMLVKGNKIVTQYTEAPEDIEEALNSNVQSKVSEAKTNIENNMSNKIRDTKTEIDQAIQGLNGTIGTINNSVTNVNNKVNNMTIGERNLWLNSKGLIASRGYLSESGKEQYAYFPSTANYKTTIPVKRDEAYTLRFSAYNSHRTYNYWITVTFTVGSNQQYRKRYSVPPRQEVTYVETHTFTVSGDAEFKVSSDSGIALNAPMLVKGNTIVSEYSEAPEDLIGLIDTKVSTAKREVNDALPDKITKGVEPIKNRVDTINQTVSGVNNTVSQMGTKVQSLDSTVSGIDTRVGTLNSSVTNVNNRVTNMTIGERNLWRRSKKMLEEGSAVSQSGYSDYKYFSSTKEFSYQLPVESGETYTLRWSVYNQYSSRHIETDITVNGRAEFNQRYNVPSRESKEVVETHTFTRSGTATFKIKSDFAMAFFPPMLVKGDKIVSKYTEAPEDIAESVESTVSTRVTTAKESIEADVETKVQKTQQDLNKNIRDTKDEITRSVGTTIVNTIQQEADKKRNLWINSKQLIERGTKVTDRGYEDYATISGNSFSYEFDVRNGETYIFRISAYNSYNYNKSCTIMFKLDGRTQTTQRHTLYRQNSKTITERYTFSGTGRGKVEVTYEWGVAFNAPMLVRGSEIDPNWIAAPEDLEKAIESKIDAKEADKKIKTAVDNVESGINDKVTEKVKEKVDPITQKVTEVETEAGKAKTAADKAKEEAEKAKQKASEASESIATVDSKITNMDIGERNLWLDSKNYIQRGDAVWDSGYDNFRWFQSTQPYSYSISVESGEYYTLRFTAFNTHANYSRTITITISIGGSNQFSKTYTIGPKQSKLVVETARMGRTGSAEFKVVSNYGMAFNPPMLVKGNKIVSEYTEAPEDLEKTLGKKVDSKVSDAKTQIEDSVAGKVTQAVSGALDDVKTEISGDVTNKVNSAKDEIKRNIGTTVAEKIEEVQNKDINLWVNSKRHLEQGRQINDDGYSNYYYFSQHSTVAYELPVKSGETYTIKFSAYNEQDRHNRNIRVKFYLNDTLQHNGANNNVWRRSTKNIVETYTFNGNGIGKIEITSDYGAAYTPPMLVKGSEISTEWKPSPQDIFDDINEAIEQKASDVEHKLSEQISSMREGFVSDSTFDSFRNQYNSMLDKEAEQRKEIEKEVSKIDRENAILRVNVEKYGAFFEGLNRYVAIQDGLFIGHNSRSTGISITDNRIDFMDGGQSVAEITSQQMKINRGIFIEMLTIGEHVIRKDTEGVTSISWVG